MTEKIVPHIPSAHPCSTSRGLYISCEFWFADRFISSDKAEPLPWCRVAMFHNSAPP